MAYMYPYGDSQQLNLSWFLAKFKELYEYVMQLDPGGSGADVTAILSRFTEQYDSSRTYIPGDYCIYAGYIYKANTTTGGTFDSSAWDAALPVNDVQGLRILLGGLSEDLTELEQNAVTNTQYSPGAATADGLLRQTKNGTAKTVMTVDKEPTANSQNPVKSGAVYSELDELKGAINGYNTRFYAANINSLSDLITKASSMPAYIAGIFTVNSTTANTLTGVSNSGTLVVKKFGASDNLLSYIGTTGYGALCSGTINYADANNPVITKGWNVNSAPSDAVNIKDLVTWNNDLCNTTDRALNIVTWGKIAIITFGIQIKGGITSSSAVMNGSSSGILCTLPAEYAPKRQVFRGLFYSMPSNDTDAEMTIRYGGVEGSNNYPTGVLYINKPYFSTNRYMAGSITYFLA